MKAGKLTSTSHAETLAGFLKILVGPINLYTAAVSNLYLHWEDIRMVLPRNYFNVENRLIESGSLGRPIGIYKSGRTYHQIGKKTHSHPEAEGHWHL